jgi:hypothetical protein
MVCRKEMPKREKEGERGERGRKREKGEGGKEGVRAYQQDISQQENEIDLALNQSSLTVLGLICS